MKTYFAGLVVGCFLLGTCQSVQAESSTEAFVTVESDALTWAPIPNALGAKYAIVYGDPSKAGTYVMRVHFPAGVMDLPHSHSRDRHVTVIEGEWTAGTGLDFDPAKAEHLSAGSYMFHPANGIHWDGAATGQDAIVQIIGEGPVATMQNHGEDFNWVPVQ